MAIPLSQTKKENLVKLKRKKKKKELYSKSKS